MIDTARCASLVLLSALAHDRRCVAVACLANMIPHLSKYVEKKKKL
jgi:hypothetical protein